MATSQLLKQFISLGIITLPSVIYWTLLQECAADASWNNFALCSGCTGKRLIVPGNLFQPRLIAKGTSLIWVRMDCSNSCANQDSCHAFNFYENETFYVCELLSDNLRRNKGAVQVIDHPGCSVWEKVSSGVDSVTTEINTESTTLASTTMTDSSFATNPESSTGKTAPSTAKTSPSTKITASLTTGTTSSTTEATSQLCAEKRWGCLGTYPDCHSCIKTCVDFLARDDINGPIVNLWPDGDGPDSMPITVQCEMDSTILSERKLNLTNRTEIINNTMSIYDMHRFVKLNAYKYLRFSFQTSFKANISMNSRDDKSDYINVFMNPNGTLSNLMFNVSNTSTVDIFNLNGQPMKPTSFVNVTDDRYGCGSFWLLDASNATYCPGGATGIFGTLRTNGTRVVNTGIRIPGKPSGYTYYVKVTLANEVF